MTGVVLADGVPVGKAGFHEVPDADGTVEVGYEIDPAYRRRGLARAALAVPADRAREAPEVTPGAGVGRPVEHLSLQLVRSRGFVAIGEEIDEEDGLEIVHALDVAARPTGSPDTRLVVLRGNSGSGKSTVARALQRERPRDLAWVGQDLLRREVLRARDVPGATAMDLVDPTARFALDRGLHVVVDGILGSWKYGAMLRCLRRDHVGRVGGVPLGRAARGDRAPARDQAGRRRLRRGRAAGVVQPRPLVPGLDEVVLGPEVTADAALARIRGDAGL